MQELNRRNLACESVRSSHAMHFTRDVGSCRCPATHDSLHWPCIHPTAS